MRHKIIPVLLLTVIDFSCETTECCLPIDLDSIIGDYIVYEYGYSPGDRYIVGKVPAIPAQLLRFDPLGGFSSNYPGFSEFKYYRIYEHPYEGKVLGFFNEPPPSSDQVDLSTLEHSYLMDQEGKNLKLYYRYCIEGCHIGVRKIK